MSVIVKGCDWNDKKIKQFVSDRNAAIRNFIETDNPEIAKRFCKKYKIPIPLSRKAFAGGIYKAAQGCTGISESIKKTAIHPTT